MEQAPPVLADKPAGHRPPVEPPNPSPRPRPVRRTSPTRKRTDGLPPHAGSRPPFDLAQPLPNWPTVSGRPGSRTAPRPLERPASLPPVTPSAFNASPFGRPPPRRTSASTKPPDCAQAVRLRAGETPPAGGHLQHVAGFTIPQLADAGRAAPRGTNAARRWRTPTLAHVPPRQHVEPLPSPWSRPPSSSPPYGRDWPNSARLAEKRRPHWAGEALTGLAPTPSTPGIGAWRTTRPRPGGQRLQRGPPSRTRRPRPSTGQPAGGADPARPQQLDASQNLKDLAPPIPDAPEAGRRPAPSNAPRACRRSRRPPSTPRPSAVRRPRRTSASTKPPEDRRFPPGFPPRWSLPVRPPPPAHLTPDKELATLR